LWQGWLSKTGSKDTNWRSRFFRLRVNGQFEYFEKEESAEAKGACDLTLATGVRPVKNGFYIDTPERVWHISRSDNSQDLSEIIVQLQMLVDAFQEQKKRMGLSSGAKQAALRAQISRNGENLEHNLFSCLLIPGPEKGSELQGLFVDSVAPHASALS
jgi:hypothetical protein